MCKFCEGLFEANCTMNWVMRNRMGVDNCEEKLNTVEPEYCYTLSGDAFNNKYFLQCSYDFRTEDDFVMSNFTELLPINFCPYCGKMLCEKEHLTDPNDIYEGCADFYTQNDEPFDYENYVTLKEVKNEVSKAIGGLSYEF